MKIHRTRAEYIRSLDQLLTISSILAGFAFSGLIAMPSIESANSFKTIIAVFHGNFDLVFYSSFYALFFASLCFLSTMMTVFVYRVSNYFIPIKKLQRVHIISNLVFSLAIIGLIISVVVLGIPNQFGLFLGMFFGIGIAACFIWENMVPWQRKRRQAQMEKESQANPSDVSSASADIASDL